MVDLPLNGRGCQSRLRQLGISENMVDWSEGEGRLGAIPAADIAGGSRLMSEDDVGTLTRLAMCDVPDELVADLGHVCDASGVGVEIEVTALPLSSPARRIIAEDPDLVPRLAGAGDDYELVFALPPDASPAIECIVPELALAITATGAIETKAGVRLVDADRKRVPISACGWQHF
jgi:thiamine monophosphate kinase